MGIVFKNNGPYLLKTDNMIEAAVLVLLSLHAETVRVMLGVLAHSGLPDAG